MYLKNKQLWNILLWLLILANEVHISSHTWVGIPAHGFLCWYLWSQKYQEKKVLSLSLLEPIHIPCICKYTYVFCVWYSLFIVYAHVCNSINICIIRIHTSSLHNVWYVCYSIYIYICISLHNVWMCLLLYIYIYLYISLHNVCLRVLLHVYIVCNSIHIYVWCMLMSATVCILYSVLVLIWYQTLWVEQ